MTPLQINQLIHYNNASGDDWKPGAWTAYPVLLDALIDLSEMKLLRDNSKLLDQSLSGHGARFEITPRGRAHVDFLCRMKPPIEKWVPDERDNEPDVLDNLRRKVFD